MITSQGYLPLRSSHHMEMETIRVNMTVRKPINPKVGRQARVVIYRAIPKPLASTSDARAIRNTGTE